MSLRSLTKTYGDHIAVDDVSLDIAPGEFLTMLGPSGSGKTTLLRIIAGFVTAESGQVLLHGSDVSRQPPYLRRVNTVFQHYALFPHMNVRENVEYGLRVKRLGRDERRRRAGEALEMVQLATFGDRKPDQLSGGQRQRIALARALANEPEVLLLDEPLGALDLKLRQEMQLELKRIHRDVGITFIFVTHDQEEALTMSDRIVVMNAGGIEQIGAPADVYERPASEFVAGFIGVSNVLTRDGSKYTIRPEKIAISTQPPPAEAGLQVARGQLLEVVYLGMVTRYVVALETGERLIAVRQNRDVVSGADGLVHGQSVFVSWLASQTFAIAADSKVQARQ